MEIKNWEKKIAVSKVLKSLELCGIKGKKFIHPNIHGDITASWERSRKEYLIHIIPFMKRSDIDEKSFKDTVSYCRENNLRFLVVAWDFENKLFDYTMDLEGEESLPFKLIRYERMEGIIKELMVLLK